MSYFAVVVARIADGWRAAELDLDDAETLDDVAEAVRDVSDTGLLFVEEDDEYVGIVRLVADADDPQVFLSDASAAEDFDLASVLADSLVDEDDELDDDPIGDAALLSDLGTSARELLALIAHEGTLPSDVISAVCEKAGCLDALEGVRV